MSNREFTDQEYNEEGIPIVDGSINREQVEHRN